MKISETHEWRSLQDFRQGDFLHHWGEDLEVTDVKVMRKSVEIFYLEDGEEKRIQDKKSEEYIGKIR